jgi:hypothetical protein
MTLRTAVGVHLPPRRWSDPARPRLFHLAMRIQHVTQAAKSWPADTPAEREEGARLADTIEHIHWRPWHGQVGRALDLIRETLVILEATATTMTPEATAAGKVAAVLVALETYVAGQSELIIDYATTRHSEEPISTATTESTVPWLLHRRMGANQMGWTAPGISVPASGSCKDQTEGDRPRWRLP